MGVSDILNILLPFVYVLVFAALIWLIVELVLLIRKTRNTVNDIKKTVEPTLAHIEKISSDLEPVVSKFNPLVDRVSLTVDAANLEIMRLDQILEDVSEVTKTVSSATNAVDAVASAPLELVSNVTSKVRKAFKPAKASPESVSLGEKKITETAHEAVEGIKEAVAEQGAAHQKRSAERQVAVQEKRETSQALNDAAYKVATSVLSSLDEPNPTGGAPKQSEVSREKENPRYYTYEGSESDLWRDLSDPSNKPQ